MKRVLMLATLLMVVSACHRHDGDSATSKLTDGATLDTLGPAPASNFLLNPRPLRLHIRNISTHDVDFLAVPVYYTGNLSTENGDAIAGRAAANGFRFIRTRAIAIRGDGPDRAGVALILAGGPFEAEGTTCVARTYGQFDVIFNVGYDDAAHRFTCQGTPTP